MEMIFVDESNPLRESVIESIREFDSEGLLDYINDPFTFEIGVVYEDEKPIAFAILKVIEEYKIAIAENLHPRQKAVIIKEFMSEASIRRKSNEVVVFLTKGGEPYEQFLKRHFGFQSPDGIPLKLEV